MYEEKKETASSGPAFDWTNHEDTLAFVTKVCKQVDKRRNEQKANLVKSMIYQHRDLVLLKRARGKSNRISQRRCRSRGACELNSSTGPFDAPILKFPLLPTQCRRDLGDGSGATGRSSELKVSFLKSKKWKRQQAIKPILIESMTKARPTSKSTVFLKSNFAVEDEKDLNFVPYFGDDDEDENDVLSEFYDTTKREELIDCGPEHLGKDRNEYIDQVLDIVADKLEESFYSSSCSTLHLGLQGLTSAMFDVRDHISSIKGFDRSSVLARYNIICEPRITKILKGQNIGANGNGTESSNGEKNNTGTITSLPTILNSEMTSNGIVPYEGIMDSFRHLFCRRCFVYDCNRHGIVPQNNLELQTALAIRKETEGEWQNAKDHSLKNGVSRSLQEKKPDGSKLRMETVALPQVSTDPSNIENGISNSLRNSKKDDGSKLPTETTTLPQVRTDLSPSKNGISNSLSNNEDDGSKKSTETTLLPQEGTDPSSSKNGIFNWLHKNNIDDGCILPTETTGSSQEGTDPSSIKNGIFNWLYKNNIDDGSKVPTDTTESSQEGTDLLSMNSSFPSKEFSTVQHAVFKHAYQVFQGNHRQISNSLGLDEKDVRAYIHNNDILSKFDTTQYCQVISPPVEKKGNKKKKRRYNESSKNNFDAAWLKRVQTAEIHPSFEPCDHAEPCSEETCSCAQNAFFCTKHCLWGKDSKYFFHGCKCKKGECNLKTCPCFASGRECDPDLCNDCGACTDEPNKPATKQRCRNDNIGMRRHCHLLVAKSHVEEAGWGIYTKTALKKGDFIHEYVGELISQEEADRRGCIYDKVNRSYLFNLTSDSVIDASRKGNKTKFMNHSSNPNCFTKVVWVNGDARIGIYAKEDIEPQTELYFDYRYDVGMSNNLIEKPALEVAWMKKDKELKNKVRRKHAKQGGKKDRSQSPTPR